MARLHIHPRQSSSASYHHGGSFKQTEIIYKSEKRGVGEEIELRKKTRRQKEAEVIPESLSYLVFSCVQFMCLLCCSCRSFGVFGEEEEEEEELQIVEV